MRDETDIAAAAFEQHANGCEICSDDSLNVCVEGYILLKIFSDAVHDYLAQRRKEDDANDC